MSLLTRKRASDAELAGLRGRARRAAKRAVPIARQAVPIARQRAAPIARQAVPIAKQAVPMAKQAGAAARQSAEDVVAWATPHVEGARQWAAPQLERTSVAVRETIAPRISDALVSAAQRLDTTPAPKRRRWPRLLAGTVMLAALASAAAAIAKRRQRDAVAYEQESYPAADRATSPTVEASDGATPPTAGEADRLADADGSQAEAEVNGRLRTS